MRQSLIDLIERMESDEPTREEGISVGWMAMREGEKLNDLTMVPELLAYYSPKLKSGFRGNLIFTLVWIGRNTQDPSCVEALLTIAKKETLKYNLDRLLSGLGHIVKPAETDLTLVFDFLRDKRWLVRHGAIRALSKSSSPLAEPEILALLARTDDKYDMMYCHATLGAIGTEAALPLLTENVKSRKPDVRHSAKYAIEAIQERLATTTSPENGQSNGNAAIDVLFKTLSPKLKVFDDEGNLVPYVNTEK